MTNAALTAVLLRGVQQSTVSCTCCCCFHGHKYGHNGVLSTTLVYHNFMYRQFKVKHDAKLLQMTRIGRRSAAGLLMASASDANNNALGRWRSKSTSGMRFCEMQLFRISHEHRPAALARAHVGRHSVHLPAPRQSADERGRVQGGGAGVFRHKMSIFSSWSPTSAVQTPTACNPFCWPVPTTRTTGCPTGGWSTPTCSVASRWRSTPVRRWPSPSWTTAVCTARCRLRRDWRTSSPTIRHASKTPTMAAGRTWT